MKHTALAILVFLAAAGCSDKSKPSGQVPTASAKAIKHYADLVVIHKIVSEGGGLQMSSRYSMFADSAEFQPDGSLLLTGLSFRRPQDSPDDAAATGGSAKFSFKGGQSCVSLSGLCIEVTQEDMEGGTPEGLLLLKDFLSSRSSDVSDEATND